MAERHFCRNFQKCTRCRDESERPCLHWSRGISGPSGVANPREIECPGEMVAARPLPAKVHQQNCMCPCGLSDHSDFCPGVREELPEWEFNHFYGDDPYLLTAVPSGLHSVLDVGGNVGFFSIVARHYFPAAVIHSYEPPPGICAALRKTSALSGTSNGFSSWSPPLKVNP
jgi:hypothetical protein